MVDENGETYSYGLQKNEEDDSFEKVPVEDAESFPVPAGEESVSVQIGLVDGQLVNSFPATSLTVEVEGCEEAEVTIAVSEAPEDDTPEFEDLPPCTDEMEDAFTVNVGNNNQVCVTILLYYCDLATVSPRHTAQSSWPGNLKQIVCVQLQSMLVYYWA